MKQSFVYYLPLVLLAVSCMLRYVNAIPHPGSNYSDFEHWYNTMKYTNDGQEGVYTGMKIPGVEHLSIASDVLTQDKLQSIFVFEYNEQKVECPRGVCYDVPDGVTFSPVFSCDMNGVAHLFTSMVEYKDYSTSRSSVGGSMLDFSGSLSSETTSVHESLEKYYLSTSYTYVECIEYRLSTFAGSLKLNPAVVNLASRLPKVFNNNTQSQYFEFFDIVGTVFSDSTTVGGYLKKQSKTENKYIRTFDSQTTKTQAEVDFFFEATGSSEYGSQLTEEYVDNTDSSSIHAVGGGYWSSGESQLTDWAASVPKAVAEIYRKYQPIWRLFGPIWGFNYNFTAPEAVVEQAALAYLVRLGCLNPSANNYNSKATVDDGSCEQHIAHTDEYRVQNGQVSMTPVATSVCALVFATFPGFGVAGTGGCTIYASGSDANAVWIVRGWDNAACGSVCTYLTFTTSTTQYTDQSTISQSTIGQSTIDKSATGVTNGVAKTNKRSSVYEISMVHSDEFRVQNGNRNMTPYQSTTCVLVYNTHPGFGQLGLGGCTLMASSDEPDAVWVVRGWDNAACGAVCYEVVFHRM